MGGDDREHTFTLTEFCRAIVQGLNRSAAETCAPYSAEACPKDLAAARAATWPMPSYPEHYSSCAMPLGTALPRTPPPDTADAISAVGAETRPRRQPLDELCAAVAISAVAWILVYLQTGVFAQDRSTRE